MALFHIRRPVLAACLIVFGLALPEGGATAQGTDGKAPAPMTAEERQAEVAAAWAAANTTATLGPATVKLLDQAEFTVPKGTAYVPAAEAARVLRAYGNTVSDSNVGLVTDTDPNSEWVATIEFVKDGYIKDDEAKDWKADELLANIKEGTEQANADRVARGFSKLDVVGWVEKPTYDAATHRLVWSLSTRNEGAPAGADNGVEYNTYALGRDGYFSLDMITTASRIAARKPVAQELLSNLVYLPGKRYQDFDASTDKTAAYGIAALVGGALVAKKLGLFALALAFVAKFAKVGLLALAAVGAVLAKVFGRKKKGQPEPATPGEAA